MDNSVIRIMDQNTTQRIRDLLESNQKIAIAVGKNPRVDDMAAALALYLSLASSGKKATIASPATPLVEVSSLVGINKVSTELDSEGNDLIVSFPYKEGEIEKVSYTLEDGLLNIIVKAGENGLAFNQKDVRYRKSGGAPTLLFVVGTPRLSDLGHLFDVEALKNTTVVNIDNKTDNQEFGDVVLVSSQFSSVSEQMAHLLSGLGLEIDLDIAQNLLAGISFATDNFQKPSTSVSAFEMAALLMKRGAVRTRTSVSSPQGFVDPFFGGMSLDHTQPGKQQQDKGSQRQKMQQYPSRQQQRNQTQPFKNQQHQGTVSQAQAPTGGSRPAVPAEEKDDYEAPPDWLAPKVYKGSTLI